MSYDRTPCANYTYLEAFGDTFTDYIGSTGDGHGWMPYVDRRDSVNPRDSYEDGQLEYTERAP